jgi:hypothetical protein
LCARRGDAAADEGSAQHFGGSEDGVALGHRLILPAMLVSRA